MVGGGTVVWFLAVFASALPQRVFTVPQGATRCHVIAVFFLLFLFIYLVVCLFSLWAASWC